jgi:hypothetical protein
MFFPSQPHFYSHLNYPVNNQIPQYPPLPYPPTNVAQQIPTSYWQMTAAQPTLSQPALKSSKSYGDILAEIKKEEGGSTARYFICLFQ